MTHQAKPDLALVMPYYMNPTMLSIHYQMLKDLPDDVKSRLEVIIIDDGSPEEKAEDVFVPADLPRLRIFYVEEDKPWHQHAARNIGAHEAKAPMLLLTDMDHLCTPELLAFLLAIQPTSRTAWFLPRVEYDTGAVTLDRLGKPKSHPNTFFISRKLFWKVGGYDEDYCGVYGTDGLFRHRLISVAAFKRLESPPIRRLHRGLVADASTRDVQRKEGRPPGFREKIAAWKKENQRPAIVTLSMPYRKVL
jgi:GT2 family glycosyltransferase